MPKPKLYTGKRGNDAAYQWCLQIRGYLRTFENTTGKPLSDGQKLAWVQSYFAGDARVWWETFMRRCDAKETSVKIPVDIEEFFLIVIKEFGDRNAAEKRRREYETMMQGKKSAKEFHRELQRLAGLLDPIPNGYDRTRRFYSGLSDSIRSRLMELNVDISQITYEELVDAADRIEEARKEYTVRGQVNEISVSTPEGQLNAMRTPPKKGTPEWSNWCRTKKLCFSCGSSKHSIKSCEQKKDSIKSFKKDKKKDKKSKGKGKRKVNSENGDKDSSSSSEN